MCEIFERSSSLKLTKRFVNVGRYTDLLVQTLVGRHEVLEFAHSIFLVHHVTPYCKTISSYGVSSITVIMLMAVRSI